jgi:hypothetical protein
LSKKQPDLIQKFNNITDEIKKKEKPVLKICSFCKKATDDWIQVVTYDNGVKVEGQNYIRCDACRKGSTKKK